MDVAPSRSSDHSPDMCEPPARGTRKPDAKRESAGAGKPELGGGTANRRQRRRSRGSKKRRPAALLVRRRHFGARDRPLAREIGDASIALLCCAGRPGEDRRTRALHFVTRGSSMPLLTVPPRSVFTTFMNFPLATDLDRLDAHVAIIGMPYGDPYSIDEVTNDQTNAPTAIRRASHPINQGPDPREFYNRGPGFDGQGIKGVRVGDLARPARRLS